MPAKPQVRLLHLEVRVPPHLSRKLLAKLHDFCTAHNHCGFDQVSHKRAPRDAKMRANHQRALETLRLIAMTTSKPGVAHHMRKLARDTLKEIS